MEMNLTYLTSILTSVPGNLLYHMVIGLALVLICGLAIPKLNLSNYQREARHVLIGCSILLILQIILFGASLVSTLSPFVLSLLESLTSTLSIIWVIWIFNEKDQQFRLNGVNIFLTLVLFIITTASLMSTVLQKTATQLDDLMVIILWQVGALFLIGLGLILTFTKRPQQWVIAVCILVMLASGHGLFIITHEAQNLNMGSIRLAQILSLPWLIVIVQRFAKPKLEQSEKPETLESKPEEKHVDTKPTLIDYLLRIPLQETQHERSKAVARAVSLSVLSDICCVFKLQKETDTIEMVAGYDLIREEFLRTTSITNEALPHILESWRENRVLKLSKSHTGSRDFTTLTNLINYPRLGNLLAYPLSTNTDALAGGLVLLTPYTEKPWDEETIALLNEIKPSLTKVLFRPPTNEKIKNDYQNAIQEIQQLIRKKESLESELLDKEIAVQNLESALEQWKAKSQIEKLESTNRIKKMNERLDKLATQAGDQAKTFLKLEHMQAEIRQLNSERNQLRADLTKAESKIEELKIEQGQTGPIRLSMDTQVVSLDSIMANVRLRIASQVAANQIELDIINPDGHQMMKTDPELTQRILFGLLENAVKASSPGGRVKVSQKLSLETGMLIIQVTDHGEGLTQAEQKQLFSAEPETNPGIGSIQSVREAIRAIRVLNGKIWLKSKKGAYTTFRVQLPVRIID